MIVEEHHLIKGNTQYFLMIFRLEVGKCSKNFQINLTADFLIPRCELGWTFLTIILYLSAWEINGAWWLGHRQDVGDNNPPYVEHIVLAYDNLIMHFGI